MPQVRVTAAAFHFCARHAMTRVGLGFHRSVCGRRIKTGPARARMILRFRAKQRLAATNALIRPWRVGILILAGKGRLGTLEPRHMILIWRELLLPLGVILANLLVHLILPVVRNRSGLAQSLCNI